jgi:hypothetical protein
MKRASRLALVIVALGCSASAMFTSEDPKRLNFKVVMLSEDLGLSVTTVRKLHEQLPSDSKDKLRTVTFGTIQTIFFDFAQPKMAPVNGYQVRMHFYALDAASPVSEKDWDVSEARALGGVDGLVLAVRCDSKGQCDGTKAEKRVRSFLEKAGYDWTKVPVVYEVHPKEGGAVPSLDAVRSAVGASHRQTVVGPGDGSTVIAHEVFAAYKAGQLGIPATNEDQAAAEQLKIRTFALADWYKEAGAAKAHTFAAKVPGNPDIYVFHFPATGQRDHETYATFARRLSQYELVAHTLVADENAADVLASINSAEFGPYALVHAGSPSRPFLLIPPVAWVQEVPKAAVRFLQVIPLTRRELAFGRKAGGRALAEKLNLAARGPAFGWKRTEKDSVVAGD